MIVSRRVLIKQLAFASAGIALVSSFKGCSSKPALLYKNIILTEDQDRLIALISETLIPNTMAPGAPDVPVHNYCAKMIDDCLSKKDQEKFLKGLTQFSALNEKTYKKDFTAMDSADRVKFLSVLNKSETEDDANFFFRAMKQFTLRGYTTSEYFMTNVQGYKMIPGKYKGCVPLNNPS